MTQLVLHNYDLDDACYRVRLVASCCDLPVELRNVDMFPGMEQVSPPYLKLNPLGRLPILETADVTLRHTGAILLYLAGLDPQKRLLPTEASALAQMMDWLFFAERDLSVASTARAISIMDVPGDGPATIAQTRALLRIMEDHMSAQEIKGLSFFAGEEITLADLALFPAFALSRDCNIDHDAFPALRLWARRVRATPGFVVMPGIPDYH